jgi:hypothetical protein
MWPGFVGKVIVGSIFAGTVFSGPDLWGLCLWGPYLEGTVLVGSMFMFVGGGEDIGVTNISLCTILIYFFFFVQGRLISGSEAGRSGPPPPKHHLLLSRISTDHVLLITVHLTSLAIRVWSSAAANVFLGEIHRPLNHHCLLTFISEITGGRDISSTNPILSL